MSADADDRDNPRKRPVRRPAHYPVRLIVNMPEAMADALELEADAAEVSLSGAARAAIEAGLPRLRDRRRKARTRTRTGAAE